jgi:hypothetical protein
LPLSPAETLLFGRDTEALKRKLRTTPKRYLRPRTDADRSREARILGERDDGK